jgi:hypothetical protein
LPAGFHKRFFFAGGCATCVLAGSAWYGLAANNARTLPQEANTPQQATPQQPGVPGEVARPQAPAQAAYDTVGPIEGESITVQGPLNIEVVRGQTKTILRSGSDVRVNSGQAHIALVEGGEIAVCGPAHFSVLKSVNLLTIALDGGALHAHIERTPMLTIYTAQLQLKPIPIGDGVQDLLIGFDVSGAMCVHPSSGALRVEQQLTAQNIVVPQGADIVVANAQLDSLMAGNGRCSCELQMAKAAAPPPELEISRPSTAEELRKDAEAKDKSAKAAGAPARAGDGEPVYQVFMPPLSYDASAKVQRDDFDPKLILFVRRVRVRPTLVFQGRVEGDAVAPKGRAQQTSPPHQPSSPPAKSTSPETSAPANGSPAQQPKKPQQPDTLMNRARSLWHKVFS